MIQMDTKVAEDRLFHQMVAKNRTRVQQTDEDPK